MTIEAWVSTESSQIFGIFFRSIVELTTTSVYFNPINSVAGSGGSSTLGADSRQDIEQQPDFLHNFDDQGSLLQNFFVVTEK